MRRARCAECGRWAFLPDEDAGAVYCLVCIVIPPSPAYRISQAWKDEPAVTFRGDEDERLRREGRHVMFAGRLCLVLCAGPVLVGLVLLVRRVNYWLGPSPDRYSPGTQAYLVALAAWGVCVLLPMTWLFKEGEGWRAGKLTRYGRLTTLFAFYLAALLPALTLLAASCLYAAVSRAELVATTAVVAATVTAALALPTGAACLRAGFASWHVLDRPAARAAWALLPKPPITWK
ncbi:MAG: hypothetical protein ACRC33_01925 [Gemmataceae bacterium]